MKLKTFLAVTLVALAGLASATAATYKIGYSDWPGYTALEIAKQKGWFKDAGLDVELVYFEYSPSIDAFAAGKVDGVTIVAGDDMVTGASGAKSKIVCLVDYSEGSDMIVGAPGVDSIKDLKGKKSRRRAHPGGTRTPPAGASGQRHEPIRRDAGWHGDGQDSASVGIGTGCGDWRVVSDFRPGAQDGAGFEKTFHQRRRQRTCL